ncbi:hypothetical protein PhCBS80983_g01862 [Powellomyces hirtus]|uniref:Uncharacterized protein n=1 Tax=Powellomyces hirtus TaxID=109895 RepID=A0A507E8A8_9FUNG|nr:hypothetical protein PhCBS80983_g01862 [Powellomyces hirtus]
MSSPSPKSASLSPAEETALSALNDIGGRNNNSNNNFPNSTRESAREMTKEGVRIPTPEAAQPSEVAPLQTETAITVAEVSQALPLPPPSSAASAPEESTSHRHPTVPSLYSRLQYGLSQVAAANSPQTQQQPVRPANPGLNGLMPGPYPSLPPLPLHLQLAQIMSTPATNGAGAHAQLEQMNNLMQLASYVQNNVSPAQDPFPQRRIVPVKRDVEEESEEDDGIAPTEDEQRQLDAAIAAAETSGVSRQEMKAAPVQMQIVWCFVHQEPRLEQT